MPVATQFVGATGAAFAVNETRSNNHAHAQRCASHLMEIDKRYFDKLRQGIKNRPASSIPEIGVGRPFLFWKSLKEWLWRLAR